MITFAFRQRKKARENQNSHTAQLIVRTTDAFVKRGPKSQKKTARIHAGMRMPIFVI